ncbi:MAG: tetratricopeptide repeat-containing sensor histidine kinase [Ignavibacteriae bacterium]|nr:tetratricopeptide repeat-containing sensor histidine kinase [Ignavibacteriota bacterium]
MPPELQVLIDQFEYLPTVSEKLDALGSIIQYCSLNTQYESGQHYVEIAERLLESLENKNGCFNLITSIGNFCSKTGNYSKAISFHTEAERIAYYNNDTIQYCRALYNLGIVYYYLGDYTIALEYVLNSFNSGMDLNEIDANAQYSNALGEIYRQMGDYDLALKNLFRSLEILTVSVSNNRLKGQCLQNIGSVYLSSNQYDSALEYYLKALDLYQKEGYSEFEALTLNNLGALYGTMEQYHLAVEQLTKAIGIHRKIGEVNKDSITNTLTNLAEAYFRIGKHDLAIQHWLEGLSIAEPIGAKHRLFEIHKGLYSVFKKIEDYPKALHHHELYMSYKQQVYTQEASDKLQHMKVVHQVEAHKKETEIEQIKNAEMNITNQKLKELNDEKDAFLAIAAHDLKNPLTGILYIANAMKSGSCMQEEIKEFGEMLRSSAQAMFDLISNLLDSNKFESGVIEPAFASIDSAQLVRHLAKNCRQNAKPKGITVECITPEHSFVLADLQLLRQAIDNLLSNAVKYSPFGSEITVGIIDKPENSIVQIYVKDAGPGLTSDDHKKLFGKFQRLSAKPTGGEHSSGLGLSISKKLVDMMNGTIRCESEFGNGATFIIELPSTTEEVYEF